jgi:leucyl aminopeptidase
MKAFRLNILLNMSFCFLIICAVALMVKPNLGHAEVPVLADLKLLTELKLPILKSHQGLGVGFSIISEAEREKLSKLAHENGHCAGYQVINEPIYKDPVKNSANEFNFFGPAIEQLFSRFEVSYQRELSYQLAKKNIKKNPSAVNRTGETQSFDPKIKDAVNLVSTKKIEEWVLWMAAFGGRFHDSDQPNIHTQALYDKLKVIVLPLGAAASVDLISHRRTSQKTVHLKIVGSKRPNEIVVLGGHLDSVNWQYFGDNNNAPGADDNASGSAAILEALRILVADGVPERTVEFFWYAAEEVGLYGSTEIADKYKTENKDVIAVLQLDMVLHPGSGETVISSISDFTSGWLRDLLVKWNSDYLNVQIIDDKCGYACSDHAPWYQKGYPTLMPFESNTRGMNHNIHTPNDVINSASSFNHAAIFSKIAVAFEMTLANSELRQP